jgi:hypothetical protein
MERAVVIAYNGGIYLIPEIELGDWYLVGPDDPDYAEIAKLLRKGTLGGGVEAAVGMVQIDDAGHVVGKKTGREAASDD